MQDRLTKSIQTGDDSTVPSALQTQTAPEDPSPKNAADLTKDYKCNIGIKFPKTEDEKISEYQAEQNTENLSLFVLQ